MANTKSGKISIKLENGIPKYSKQEHERRWVLGNEVLAEIEGNSYSKVIDHYLKDTKMRLRSMTDSNSGQVTYKLTKKYGLGDDYSDPITTIYISKAEYEIFAGLPHFKIHKRRYPLVSDGLSYSVDVFDKNHQGLILAEIECATKEALLEVPSPPFSVKEVTEDARYRGGYLSEQKNA